MTKVITYYEKSLTDLENMEKKDSVSDKEREKGKKYSVVMTEQTAHEILLAVKQAHALKNTPDAITVSSEFSDVSFDIRLEVHPHTQESLGYRKTGEERTESNDKIDIGPETP